MKLTLSSDQSKVILLEAKLLQLSQQQRLFRGFKKFGFFFFAAVFSIFIPVLHFFLVPAFSILCFFKFYKEYQVKYFLEANPPTCLSCQQQMKATYYLDENRQVDCDTCFARYLLSSN